MNEDSDDGAAQRGSEELRALWSALPRPRAGADFDGLPSEDLADSDSATRAAVERLRSAWAAHAVEVHEVPFVLRSSNAARLAYVAPRARRARTTFALRIIALVGAAAAALIVFALRTERDPGALERATEGAVALGDPSSDVGTVEPRVVEPSPLPADSVAAHVDIPREDFKLRSDGFEFEAQGVRFVLIETTGGAQSSASETKDY